MIHYIQKCSLLLLLLFPAFTGNVLFAHGRVVSTITSDIEEHETRVDVRLAMLDVLAMEKMRIYSFKELEGDRKAAFVRRVEAGIAPRFLLLDSRYGEIRPALSWAEIPDFDSPDVQAMGVIQQAITIHYVYKYDERPSSLTFLPRMGLNHDAQPVIFQGTLKQKSILRYLSSPILNTYPVTVPLDWTEPPPDLSEISDFHQALPKAAQRPPCLDLRMDRRRIEGLLCLPLADIGSHLEDMDGWDGSANRKRMLASLQTYIGSVVCLSAGGRLVRLLADSAVLRNLDDDPSISPVPLEGFRDVRRQYLQIRLHGTVPAATEQLDFTAEGLPCLIVMLSRDGTPCSVGVSTPSEPSFSLSCTPGQTADQTAGE